MNAGGSGDLISLGPWIELQTPNAAASDGSVYVADMSNHRIQKFSIGP